MTDWTQAMRGREDRMIPAHASNWIAHLIDVGLINTPSQMMTWVNAVRTAERIYMGPRDKVAFTGGMTKTQLQETMRACSRDLRLVSTMQEFHDLMDAYHNAIEDCKRHMGTWAFGDGRDSQGILAEIEAKKQELE